MMPHPLPAPPLPSLPAETPAVQAGHFNAYASENFGPQVLPYNRRDFYKIALLTQGRSRLHHAAKSWEIQAPALVFSNLLVPYAWETLTPEQSGQFCVFTEEFLYGPERTGALLESPLFALGGDPVFHLSEAQTAAFAGLFQQLTSELASDYSHKYEVLRHYVHLVLHQAQKLQPPTPGVRPLNAASRITTLFLELLERQFPIDSPARPLRLRSAQDFAPLLAVHVNHLNRAVRAVTGKTTTAHVTERMVQEAKALLHHTRWTIAEIAYGLGFEYPTYFNNFFKKHTGLTPTQVRT